MPEKPIGYKNPPSETRWKPGISGNPSGRRKRKPTSLVDIILEFFSAPMQYSEQGRLKTAPREELLFRKLIEEAMKGSVPAAEFILKARINAHRFGSVGHDQLEISDWLPDYPGQTAEEKTQEFADRKDADPTKWWAKPDDAKSTTE
jgi:uncharacterized protein DUF5681